MPGGAAPWPVKRQETGLLTKSDSVVGFAVSGLFHRGEKISHEWGRAVLRPMAPNIHAPGEGLAEGLRVPALAPVCAQDSGRLCRATGYKTSRFSREISRSVARISSTPGPMTEARLQAPPRFPPTPWAVRRRPARFPPRFHAYTAGRTAPAPAPWWPPSVSAASPADTPGTRLTSRPW